MHIAINTYKFVPTGRLMYYRFMMTNLMCVLAGPRGLNCSHIINVLLDNIIYNIKLCEEKK